jgi:hypothetical protein
VGDIILRGRRDALLYNALQRFAKPAAERR